ncbi:MAG: ATP phosphoribosyltransferase [Microbacteriaceae bacterium]|jgi:ATP phosphoribosyltransferase|nr:ATP phosphoribosyltransferase [Microbacteriaceae bacterium]MCI1206751.1 ATP phosphoribosyltransferase [Microbacteriaceae bacterium]
MLRVAVPNKGILSNTAMEMLHEAGYAVRRDSRDLYVSDRHNDVDFFYLRPRDIATYVGSGALDVGITGRDLLLDSHSSADEVANLEFGGSTFHFAGPAGKFHTLEDIRGLRIGTSYPGLVGDFLKREGVDATLVTLDGAVENSVRLGVADLVADVVSTGTTLRNAGLEMFGPVILESSAVLIGSPKTVSTGELEDQALTLSRRLIGVRVAHQYVLIDYDVAQEHLEAATRLTPGLESPTVSPLADASWCAVRAMAPRDHINDIIDNLYEVGARAILVSTITTARI